MVAASTRSDNKQTNASASERSSAASGTGAGGNATACPATTSGAASSHVMATFTAAKRMLDSQRCLASDSRIARREPLRLM